MCGPAHTSGLCHYVPVIPTPARPGGVPAGADRCPGVLRPHRADDGALVRLRVPGGRLTASAFAAVRRVACECGDGDIHLTSRANVQLRALPTGADGAIAAPVVTALRTAGLLPSPAHERVRNIVASPLSGVAGGRADVAPVAAALDSAVCADPALAELPGRFLFGLDDGRGDIAALGCDVLAFATGPRTARIVVGEADCGEVPLADAAAALTEWARRFLAAADGRWRVRELPGRGRELSGRGLAGRGLAEQGLAERGLAERGRGPASPPRAPAARFPAAPPMPYGVLPYDTRPGGAVSVLAPLGVLDPAQSEAVAAAAGPAGTVVVTPWRGIVIVPGAARAGQASAALARLTATGLVADPASPWTRITACIGAPGCAKSAGDTRAAARALAATGPPPTPVHLAGCPRACGSPAAPHTLTVLRSTP